MQIISHPPATLCTLQASAPVPSRFTLLKPNVPTWVHRVIGIDLVSLWLGASAHARATSSSGKHWRQALRTHCRRHYRRYPSLDRDCPKALGPYTYLHYGGQGFEEGHASGHILVERLRSPGTRLVCGYRRGGGPPLPKAHRSCLQPMGARSPFPRVGGEHGGAV